MPSHSGRQGGKLNLAGVTARAAAARRKEDRTNVLLTRTNKTQPSTPSNREIRYQHCSDEKSQGDVPFATRTAMEGEKIIFEKLAPVAESSDESLPSVVASPAVQQPPGQEFPVTQHPCIQLITQPPSVENTPTQQGVAVMSTSAGNDDYVLPIEEEVDVTLPSNDPDEDDIATLCNALQLCYDPNSNTDNYRFCMQRGSSHHLHRVSR